MPNRIFMFSDIDDTLIQTGRKTDFNKQTEIAKLYYNQNDTYLEHIDIFDIEKYNDIDLEVTKTSGILDLNEQIKTIKTKIDSQIKQMVIS